MGVKMTINNTCLCDHCSSNLTTTGNSIDYRVCISSERIPCHSGEVTDMMIYPPIPNDLHFCGTGCLREYFKAHE